MGLLNTSAQCSCRWAESRKTALPRSYYALTLLPLTPPAYGRLRRHDRELFCHHVNYTAMSRLPWAPHNVTRVKPGGIRKATMPTALPRSLVSNVRARPLPEGRMPFGREVPRKEKKRGRAAPHCAARHARERPMQELSRSHVAEPLQASAGARYELGARSWVQKGKTQKRRSRSLEVLGPEIRIFQTISLGVET